ncbi:MAG: hypothetical protein EPO50_01080 [Reyranella sp.]|nr:MAG: hypothetical protein EPO50_01080 [Reyranella sp.]
MLQRHDQRRRRRLPPDTRLPEGRWRVVRAAQRPVGTGTAAGRPAAALTRRQQPHLCRQERCDLLLPGWVA